MSFEIVECGDDIPTEKRGQQELSEHELCQHIVPYRPAHTPVAEDVLVVVRCVGFAIRHILLSGFVISFAVETLFSNTIQLWNFITRRDRPTSPRDRRRIEEPLHTL